MLSFSTACSVSASGQIPCVDDSSCPASYPSCKAGLCSEGTTSSSAIILGVPGKSATDPVRGTVIVAVVAKASSGVKSVSLKAGSNTYSPDASSIPPVFNFSVDTTKLPDGSTSFTATLTPGDSTQPATTSAAFPIVVQNTAPTLTVGVSGSTEVSDGTLVAIDVTSSKPLASLTGTVSGSATALAQIAAPTGLTYHFGYAVTAADSAGARSITVTGVDLAGNSSSSTLTGAFNVRHPFSLGALSVSTGHTVNEQTGALPAATAGTLVTVSISVPASAALGSGKPVFKLTSSGGAVRTLAAPTLTSGSTTNTWTTSYTVVAADNDGVATVTASVTDVAGNTPTPGSASLVIDKSAPLSTGISVNGQYFDTVHNAVVISTTSSKRLQSATVSVSNGDLGTCTCDGGVCNASTSATPLVVCSIAVTHAAPATPVALLTLQDTLGNIGSGGAAYQAGYTVVPPPTTGGLSPAAVTITVGTAAVLTPSFSASSVGVVTGSDGSSATVNPGTNISVAPTAVGSYTYSLTATNAAGTSVTTSANTVVTVVAPPTIANFTVTPTEVSAGSTATLKPVFNAGPGGTASIDNGVGPVTSNGSFPVAPGQSTLYTLTVTNAAGTSAQATATLIVGQNVAVSLTAPTTPVIPGAIATLQANVGVNAASASIDPGGLAVTANGSNQNISVTPAATTTYTLTATNNAGDTFKTTATVTVTPPKVIAFSGPAYWTTGASGLTLTVSFNASAGATASVNNSCTPASASASPATFNCPPITADTTYTATVTLGTGPGSTATAQTKVLVAPDPTNTSLAGPLSAINPGATAAFSGQGCSGCSVTFNPPLTIDTGAITGAFTAHLATNPSANTIVTMSIANQAGSSATKTAAVTVTQPVIAGFTGPSFVTTGSAPTLQAAFTPATATATVSGGCTGGAVTGTNPSAQTFNGCTNITGTTTYTLSVSLGTATVQATVQVQVAPDPNAVTLTFPGGAINPDAQANFNGVGCAGCTVTFNPPMTIDTGSVTGSFTAHLSTNPTANTTVTMSATNQAGTQATKTATALVTQPVINGFTGPTFVTTGTAPTLQASFTPSTAVATVTGGCTGGAVTGTSPATQSFSGCSPITGTMTYTLTLTLGSVSVQAQAQMQVAPDPTNTSLGSTNSPVNPGAVANFSGQGCANCTVTFSPALTLDSGAVTGSFTAHLSSNPTSTTTVTMTVTNQAGTSATKTAPVTVTQPVIASFTGSSVVTSGGAPTFNAQFTPAGAVAAVTACTGGAVTGTNPASQNFTGCAAITADRTYTLTLTLGSNSVTATTQVLVAPDPAVNLNFAASPPLLPFGAATNQTSLTAQFCGGSTRCSATYSANGGAGTSIANNVVTSANQSVTTTYELVVTNTAGASATRQITVPSYGSQFLTGAMGSARIGAVVALLPTGKVLVAGGSTTGAAAGGINTAEIFDPATGKWSAPAAAGGTSATMQAGSTHFQGTATVLPNNSVLLAGGLNTSGTAVNTVDVYDIANDGFIVPANNLVQNRAGHVAVPYGGGQQVFFAGGGRSDCEVFSQGTTLTNGTFTLCAGSGAGKTMQVSRTNGIAILLPANGGRFILNAGGTKLGNASDTNADLWDTTIGAASNAFTALPTGTMTSARSQATATLLSNGKVFIAGGVNASSTSLQSAELFSFNPSTPASSVSAPSGCILSIGRAGQAAIAQNGGGILIAGGTNGTSCSTTATNCNVDAYDPVADSCGTTFTLSTARTTTFGAALLLGGRSIFGGGTTAATAADYIVP